MGLVKQNRQWPELEKVLGDAMDQWLRGKVPYPCTEPHWCAAAVVAWMQERGIEIPEDECRTTSK